MDKDRPSYAERLADMAQNVKGPEDQMRERIATEAGYIASYFKSAADSAAAAGKRKTKHERESFIYTLKKAGRYSGFGRKSVILDELAETATDLLLDDGFMNVKVVCKCTQTIDNQFFYRSVVTASW